jgi:hypothetical protein
LSRFERGAEKSLIHFESSALVGKLARDGADDSALLSVAVVDGDDLKVGPLMLARLYSARLNQDR